MIPKLGNYLVDRRVKSFILYEKIISRQVSKNVRHAKLILVKPKPSLTTIFVIDSKCFFGKIYLNVLVTTNNDCLTGFIRLNNFANLVRTNIKWECFEPYQ